MRFRASSTWPVLPHHVFRPHQISHPAAAVAAAAAFLRRPATLSRALHATPSSGNSGGGGGAQDNYLLVPGATMATILMLGILHARRLYDDKKSLQPRRRLRIVVVLEGQSGVGFIAPSAIGATNVGSIKVAGFKMGSTVPVSESLGDGLSSDFRFCVKSGDKAYGGRGDRSME